MIVREELAKRAPIVVEFSADEFEKLANLCYRRARGDDKLAGEIITAARRHGLKPSEDRPHGPDSMVSE